ncbi:MAG TPA: ATP-binding protein [Solirubrobacteraceae bacterium]|nr:ATP-binding protein [Solirubrobacteraceae bacterium]
MRLPIRIRLTAWYALFLAAIMVALGAFLVLKLRADLRATIDREVRTSSAAITASYGREGAVGFRETAAAALIRSGSFAQVADTRGGVLTSFGGDTAQDPVVAPARLAVDSRAASLIDVDGGDAEHRYRALITPVPGSAGQYVVVAESLQGVDEAVRKILVLLLIAVPVALAIAGIGGWLLVRNALLPVDRMRRKADRIGIDHLHERLAAPHPSDEIGALAITLNAMLDRLEAGVSARRALVADASHELRTPLASMRAELDVSLRDPERTPAERATLESVREDVIRMSRTVDNLLTLARADEGALELVRGPVELDRAVESVVGTLHGLADARGVTLIGSGRGGTVQADERRLTQALTNLVENAIKYTAPGGEVVISSWRGGERAGVSVVDTGTGIPVQDLERIFDRFYRADPSRGRESGGSGLGLAICQEIATAHGGSISVQSKEGSGSTFTLTLPAAAGSRDMVGAA